MLYATLSDMIDAFGERELIQLSDRANDGVINEQAIERALERASADIDGYMGWLQAKSINASEQALTVLRGLCCDMARYRLAGSDGRLVTDEMRDRHKDAIGMLKMIAKGEIKLMSVDEQAPAQQDRVMRLSGQSRIARALEDY